MLCIIFHDIVDNLLQAFSSDSSLQSGLSLQNNSFSTHSPLPQESLPSGHTGSSVFKIGITLRGSIHFISAEEITKKKNATPSPGATMRKQKKDILIILFATN